MATENTSDPQNNTEPTVVHPVPVPVEPQKERSIFVPLILGGAFAAALGFFGSELGLIGGDTSAETERLQSEITEHEKRLVAQNARIKELETLEPTVDLGPITALEQQLSVLSDRLTDLENRPVVVNEGGQVVDTSAIERQLAALQADIAAQRQDIEAQRAEMDRQISEARSVEEATAEAAKTASAQAILVRIFGALDAGQPFESDLQDLQALDVAQVPDALSTVSADGVRTLSALQEDFPPAARAALTIARDAGEDDSAAGLGGFLKRQLGARSVEPREGDDPDAVLSRVEAAVKSGDMATALQELDGLSDSTGEPLAEWRAALESRNAAYRAAESLSQQLASE